MKSRHLLIISSMDGTPSMSTWFKVSSKLHEVQVRVVEPRDQGLSAAVQQFRLSVRQGQDVLVTADGGDQPAFDHDRFCKDALSTYTFP